MFWANLTPSSLTSQDCPDMMKDAKLGSFFSVFGFPIAFVTSLLLRLHGVTLAQGDTVILHCH